MPTNVNDNSNMMYKSYQDQDIPDVLPCFAPVREPGFYLDAPLLRGKYVTPIEIIDTQSFFSSILRMI